MPNENIKEYIKDDQLKAAVLEFLLAHYDHYKDVRKEFESKIKEYRKQYLSIHGDKWYEGTANIFVPATFNACETLVPRIVQGLIGRREFFKIESTENGRIAKDVQAFMQGQYTRMNFKGKFIDFIRQLVVSGTAIAKVNRDRQLEYLPTGKKGKIEAQVVYDGPMFMSVDLMNVFVDPKIKNIQDQPAVIESIWTNYANVKRNEKEVVMVGEQEEVVGIYDNVDDIEGEGFDDDRISDASKDILSARGLKDDDVSNDFAEVKARKLFKAVHLLECHFKYDLNGDGKLETCVATIANRKTIIRLEETPFDHKKYPYIKSILLPVSGQFYGRGIPEVVDDLQQELNDTENQLMDFKTFVLDNMWVISDQADINDEQLAVRPHGIIRSSDDGRPDMGVQALRPNQNILMAGISIIQLIQQNIRNASMATETMQGMPIKSTTTATEVSKVLQESMSRLILIMRSIEYDALVPFYRMCYQLDLQFMKNPEGENKNVMSDAHFTPLGSLEMESQMVKAQQLINLLNISGSIPPSPDPSGKGIRRASPLKIMEKLYEIWGYHDFEDLIELIPFPQVDQGGAGVQPQNQPSPKSEGDVIRGTNRQSSVRREG